MAAFVAGLGIAIDGTAGEQERKPGAAAHQPNPAHRRYLWQMVRVGHFCTPRDASDPVLCVVAMFALHRRNRVIVRD